MKIFKLYKFLLILIFISLILFVKLKTNNGFSYVGSSGDFLSVINPSNSIVSNSFTFRSNISNGYVDNAANLLSLNSPYIFYEFLLSKLNINQLIRTNIFIITISLISCLSMYYYLSKKRLISRSSAIQTKLLAILYGFSPYYISYYLPGHYVFLLLPALFPFIQYLFEKLLHESSNDIKKTLSYFSILSVFLLLLCAPFGNIGVLAIFYCLMVGQIIIKLLLKEVSIKQALITSSLLSLSLVISNIWWLAPYLITMDSASLIIEQSRQTIGSAIGIATTDSNILNILSGVPEGTYNIVLLKAIQICLLLLIMSCAYVVLKNKKKINIGLLILVLITIFFTKGPNNPFGKIFDYLYGNIAVLQIIRRPASKLYWILIFFLITIAHSIITSNKNKRIVLFQNILLYSSVVISVYLTVNGIKFTPFNIPSTYYQANQYLIDDNVMKIVLLPDLGGLHPEYNQELNFHKGIDILGQIWEFKKYIPSSTSWTIKDNERDLVNLFAKKIYDNTNFCELSKKLNISHIVIRKDLESTNYDQKLLDRADKVLDKSIYISQIKEFGKNFKIFKIIDSCQSQLVTSDENTKISFHKINSTKYEIRLTGRSNNVNIIFREKYNNMWVLHSRSNFSLTSQIFPIIGAKLDENIFPHIQVLDYANGWSLNLTELCIKQGNHCFEQNNEFTVDLYIEYWPQKILYISLFLSASLLLFCLGYLVYFQKINKDRSNL